jgi:hypothetical protein
MIDNPANEANKSRLKVRRLSYRRGTSMFTVSRSVNPVYSELDKLQDVTRYNSSTFNVSHYQDYPNRLGTPKKPSRVSSDSRRERSSVSPKLTKLKSLVSDFIPLGDSVRRSLMQSALNSPIRLESPGPKVVQHGCGRLNFVMNDYHSRETNAGFSRNHQFGGGFYTH